jgi:hypothetical protein
MTPTVTFSERLLPVAHEDGSVSEVPHLVGEIDATDELGCIIVYSTEIAPPVWPEKMELLKSMLGKDCVQELNRVRGQRSAA